jgi:hypothetical protein
MFDPKTYVSERVFGGVQPVPKDRAEAMRASYLKRLPWWKRLFNIKW